VRRFFRYMAITVLLVACVVLGSACAGAKGENGVGIESVVNNADGTITVDLTNGESYTSDDLTGPQGPQGVQGIQGLQGIQGIQGIQGLKGDTGLAGFGIVWQGEWSNSTAYSQDDAVGYQGLSYISKQDSNANHVPTDTDWWDLWGATGPQGEKGDKGDTGDQGPQGIQGEPGPNMIVAMGNVLADGTISRGYNVTSVTWDTTNLRYQITLTGITYSSNNYVTLITAGGDFVGRYESLSGNLLVYIYALSGQAQGPFSFMVLATP
jgi:hypothetical protein